MNRIGAILLVLLAATGAARAADSNAPNPLRFSDPQTFDWSGLKLGLQGGYAWSDFGVVAGEGVSGGLTAGYDYQFGMGLVGVEASASVADIEITPANRLNTVIDLRGRLGVSMERVLVYGTFGGAYGAATGGLDGAGWTTGAGADFIATERTIVGMEYVKYRFDDFGGTGNSLDLDLIRGKLTYRF